MSMTGVMPPAIDGNDVLVDGAIMKNFPTDVMRSMHLGPVVGVDVTRGRSISADDVARPSSVWRWILSGEWRKGPPIVALLMRTATVSTGREITASRQASDLLILPNVEGVDLRDWKAYDPTIALGHKAAIASLDALTHPVTDLRRRR
jgi:NTE family protein